MITNIVCFTLIVRNQEEALKFYTEKLGFEKRDDLPMGEGKRWLSIAPRDAQVVFTLQPLDWFEGEEREAHARLIGKNPTIVLQVDDCQESYQTLLAREVECTEAPLKTPYGLQAIFNDLYGNTLVLLEQAR